MTRDDIIMLAKQAGITSPDLYKLTVSHMSIATLEQFAKLVAEAEREECARVCKKIDVEYDGEDILATWCADAIRKRGETT